LQIRALFPEGFKKIFLMHAYLFQFRENYGGLGWLIENPRRAI
jgi:hypothetical protein